MNCPQCNCDNTVTVDSRKKRTDQTYRRRKCLCCMYRFTTVEVAVDEYKALADENAALRGRLEKIAELLEPWRL